MLIEFGSVEDCDVLVDQSDAQRYGDASPLVVSVFGSIAELRHVDRDSIKILAPYHEDEHVSLTRKMYQLMPVGDGVVTLLHDEEFSRSWKFAIDYQRDGDATPRSAGLLLVRYVDEPFDWHVVIDIRGGRVDLDLDSYTETILPPRILAPQSSPPKTRKLHLVRGGTS